MYTYSQIIIVFITRNRHWLTHLSNSTIAINNSLWLVLREKQTVRENLIYSITAFKLINAHFSIVNPFLAHPLFFCGLYFISQHWSPLVRSSIIQLPCVLIQNMLVRINREVLSKKMYDQRKDSQVVSSISLI